MDDEVVLAEAPDSEALAVEEIQEKLIPASRVEELIKKAKLKGRDAMQNELEALRGENEELRSSGSMGGMATPVDAEQMRKQIYDQIMGDFQSQDEERVQGELKKEAERLASDYRARMDGGKEIHEDFDEIMADFNPAAFPQLVYLATQTDNTSAVMYELMKNPNKLATITVLSERDPNAASNMINKISASIKANEQAKAAEKEVQSPLSRMQSSPAGRDNGDTSIADYKRMFRG